MDIKNERLEYKKSSLDIEQCPDNPVSLFKRWLQDALDAKILDATAFVLSTLGADGYPHSRVLLLKQIEENGLQFFSNYQSQKGKDLERHPQASMNFFWKEHEQQVRVLGKVKRLSTAESDAYFYSRPKGSRIGAIISAQSQNLTKRSELEEAYKKYIAMPESELKRPEHWGGYGLVPEYFEFWQGGEFRLHHRVVYRKTPDLVWQKTMLQP